MRVGRTILLASLVLAAACSRDSSSPSSTGPSASRPGRVFESNVPRWEDLAPAGGAGVIDVDFARFYEAAVRHQDAARAATDVTRQLRWLANKARECGLHLPDDVWRMALVVSPSGNLGIVTGTFDVAVIDECIGGLAPDAPRKQLRGRLAVNVSGDAWMAAPRDGALLIANSLLLDAALAPDTKRFAGDARLNPLLDRVPTHHTVRVAADVWPGLLPQLPSSLEQPPESITGFATLDEALEAGIDVTFASNDDAAGLADWYLRGAKTIIHAIGRGKLGFLRERATVTVDGRRIIVRVRVSGDELSRLISFVLAPPPPDTREFTSGLDDREIPRGHEDTTDEDVFIFVALPNGRVRLPNGDVMTDERALVYFASSEELARARRHGREVFLIVRQGEGVPVERANEFIVKVDIPGVTTGSVLSE